MRSLTTIILSFQSSTWISCDLRYFYQAKACNRQTSSYMKEDIMRAGSRVWSRCMLNGDVYRRQIGPLMRGGESQLSSSLRSSAVRPVPYGEGQKWGSNVVETKTLFHLSNAFFLCAFLHSTLSLCSVFLSAVRKWLTFKIASCDIFIDRLWQVSLRIFFVIVFSDISVCLFCGRGGDILSWEE